MQKPFVLILVFLSTIAFGQVKPTTEAEIASNLKARAGLAGASLLKNYPVRNIGPTVQGGRIVDIDVNLGNTKEFYVAFASGGIFKTINNGITFEPIFDNADGIVVGDFVLSQSDPKLMYVGTGEKNGSRSSYAGTGMYKTTNGGESWEHIGLTSSHHISRVVIDPTDNNSVWVAAIGALYSKNPERGVFKSSDGGKTWKKTLYINDSTGVIDLVINPQNPKQLWASSWERERKAWDFKGNGVGSAIYKSEDGGETWIKSMAGFPQGKQVGRIGLDVCLTQPNVLYAILDNQGEIKDEKAEAPKKDRLSLNDLRNMSKEDFLKLDNKKLDELLRSSRFPRKYNAALVKMEVREGKYLPKAIADYFGADANANLFNTKVIGAEVYRSDDGGTTWKKMNSYDLDAVFYTYGYYFAEMRVTPDDPDLIYIYGVPMLKSKDGGVTWHQLDTIGDVHVDHHALWINPKDKKHILLGNDGGLYQSYDEGANWLHINNMPVGQFYSVNVDMEEPYNVYGGLQDNGVLRGSSKSVPNRTKHWEAIYGGDGMLVAPDPTNSKIVYTGLQFGNYVRLELDKNKTTRITPQHDIGEAPLRWNWRTPIVLSKHNPDILYMGAQKVFRSLNKANDWEVISDDLTKNLPNGNVPFSTITVLAESPLKFGLLYAGTDDGNAWVSKDGGVKWDLIVNGLPANRWVSSISPSPHKQGTVFISLNGYREDEFMTHLFMSEDYGTTWKSVKGNLPEAVANVIVQDPVNPDLLYCGLDNGTYASFDKGNTWHLFNNLLPVASYDMIVHPRENELVVGTHGRSVFVVDVKPLQKLSATNKAIVAFQPASIRHSTRWGNKAAEWDTPNEPKVVIQYFVGTATDRINIEILDSEKNVVRKLEASGTKGFNTVAWDVKVASATAPAKKGKPKKESAQTDALLKYADKGKYTIKFMNGTESSEVELEIK